MLLINPLSRCRTRLSVLLLLLCCAPPIAAETLKISRFEGDYVETFVEQVITRAYARIGYKVVYLKLPPPPCHRVGQCRWQ